MLENLLEIARRPSYRGYVLHKLLRPLGYEPDQWVRVVYSREWETFLSSLPLRSLTALEISPGAQPVIEKSRVKSYRTVHFPEFDITQQALPATFDIIIAEQVFEHLRHPYRAAANIRKMLNDDGVFLIATPFLIRIHGSPSDYTRWTPAGLQGFLEDCGFTAEVRAWGNRKAVKANFTKWREYGWKRDLRNETAFPACVWAYARKTPGDAATVTATRLGLSERTDPGTASVPLD